MHIYYTRLGNRFHRAGQLDFAIEAYQKALKIDPQYPVAYNNLGNIFYKQEKLIAAKQAYEKAVALQSHYHDAKRNLCLVNYRLGIDYFKSRDFQQAKTHFESVLLTDDQYAEANQHLANTLLEMGNHEAALPYYFRQVECRPLFESYYNIGVLLMMKNRLDDAISYFHQAQALDDTDVATQINLGMIYLKKNQLDQSIIHYSKVNTLKPNDPEIQHILAGLTHSNPPSPPKEYITHLFDQYAPYYEKHLTDVLKYDMPKKMMDALSTAYPYFSDKKYRILDLGCGTGLCGPLFKPFAQSFIGIDLSEAMLQVAQQKNCYDQLIAGDITEALTQFSGIDIVVAADVFTYIGNCETIFKRVRHALAPNGLFIFTVEKNIGSDFILQPTLRYAHSKTYLTQLIAANAFEMIQFENIQLRKQYHAMVEGYLIMLRVQS